MNEFVTVRRSDPEFKRYIAGEIEAGTLAIPVESLNFGADEEVTFRLIPASERPRVSWLTIWSKACRFELLSLTLTPAIAVWAAVGPTFSNGVLGVLALCSLFFLHCGVMALNDVNDHASGIDRINEKGGSRVLQNGWLSAPSLRRLAVFNIATGVMAAVPLIFERPHIAVLVVVAAILAFVAGTHARWGYNKIRYTTEFAIFLILGPLMSLGMHWVLGGELDTKIVLLGAAFGMIAVGYLGTRHLISIVVDHLAGIKTLPVSLGFDRARLALAAIVLAGTALPVFALGFVMLVPVTLAAVIALRLMRIRSPLSSGLVEIPHLVLLLHLVTGICVVLARELGAAL